MEKDTASPALSVHSYQVEVQVTESDRDAEHPPVAPSPLPLVPPRSRRGSFFNSSYTSGSATTNGAPHAVVPPIPPAKPPLKILVASWNVGNAMPPKNPKKIHEWIPEGGGDFDVIVIGLQESSYREKSTDSRASTTGDDPTPATDVDKRGSCSSETDATGNGSPRKPADGDSEADEGFDRRGSPGGGGNDDDDGDLEDDDAENEQEDDDDEELSAALAATHQAACQTSRSSSSTHLRKLSLASGEIDGNVEPISPDRTTGVPSGSPTNSATTDNSICSLETGEVIVKRSRTKKSIRKVSKLVRQVSTNLRDSVADVLDYPFNKQIYHHLGEHYALVGKVELMEMRLFAYVHTRHTVSGIEKISVPTGLGSVLGNKGGLVFKFVIQDTSLCFVSCHLAAHQDQKFLDKRNSDCASILGANFGMKKVSLDHQFDHCFWLGDLNYRVDLNYTKQKERTTEQHFAEVLAHVRVKKWAFLNSNDQLKFQVEAKKALAGWELPPALFPPTFKRIRHAPDEYNPQRIPSYCDRVLHKSLPGRKADLTLQRFMCIEAISSSDHKPVLAEFQVQPSPSITVDTTLSTAYATLVEITELSAKELLAMDMTGLSDPYIKFYSVPSPALHVEGSGGHPSTTTIMTTLSPAWRDDQVPKLHVLCDQEKDVRLVHLVLLLMDYDTASADDVLGVATLSLDKFCLPRPRFLPFEISVERHGKAAGTVTGKLRVTMPHQAAGLSNASSSFQSGQMATCHCSLS